MGTVKVETETRAVTLEVCGIKKRQSRGGMKGPGQVIQKGNLGWEEAAYPPFMKQQTSMLHSRNAASEPIAVDFACRWAPWEPQWIISLLCPVLHTRNIRKGRFCHIIEASIKPSPPRPRVLDHIKHNQGRAMVLKLRCTLESPGNKQRKEREWGEEEKGKEKGEVEGKKNRMPTATPTTQQLHLGIRGKHFQKLSSDGFRWRKILEESIIRFLRNEK